MALEPELENYKILKENINLNNLNNIVLLLIALSDIQGSTRLSLAPGTVAHSLSFPKSNEWQEVEVNTMDGYRRTQAPAGCIVKIDAEGAALNILSQAENMSCRKIVIAAYHFPMEKVQVSMRLRDLGFKTEIKHMRASIYRNPINLFVPIVLAGKILNVLGFIFCFLAYWFLLTATFSF